MPAFDLRSHRASSQCCAPAFVCAATQCAQANVYMTKTSADEQISSLAVPAGAGPCGQLPAVRRWLVLTLHGELQHSLGAHTHTLVPHRPHRRSHTLTHTTPVMRMACCCMGEYQWLRTVKFRIAPPRELRAYPVSGVRTVSYTHLTLPTICSV